MADLNTIKMSFASQYPSLNRWLAWSTKSELIIDDKVQGCIFAPMGSADGFEVRNPSSRLLGLIQIDGRLLPADEGGQCDGCFFYDDSINLLEFKTDTITTKKATARNRYHKAEKQLINTIIRLKAAGVDILSLASDVEAFICFNNSFPRTKAGEMARSIRFAQKTGGIGLSFANFKEI